MKNSSTPVMLQKKEPKAEVNTARMQNHYKLAEDSAISSIYQLSAKSSPATATKVVNSTRTKQTVNAKISTSFDCIESHNSSLPVSSEELAREDSKSGFTGEDETVVAI